MGCAVGSFSARSAYLRCLSSSNGTAGVRAASLISGPIGVVLSVPVIALACLLTNRCSSSAHVFWPCHQISAPYKATDCTAAIWTLRTSPGDSPYVLDIDLSLFSAALAFYSLVW
jgi:hypothetical protein